MHFVVKCESGYKPQARNYNPPIEDSRGIVQINLLAHSHITVEQAEDIEFSLNFLAENISKNNGRIWTCHRKIPTS